MKDEGLGRRDFLKRAVAGGAAAAAGLPAPAAAQTTNATPDPAAPAAGYTFLNPEEAAFVEALVDHMIPADAHTPKGTAVGVNTYIDRALAGSWGKGDRLYMQGPWKQGVPGQGYQLPLTPSELYRAGIAATNRHCMKAYGKPFDRIADKDRQEVLVNLSGGKLAFDDGLPSPVFFAAVYQTVMEGMFADPVYGGNRNKAGWKMVGFPGVIAVHQQDIINYRNKKYASEPTGIADVS